MRDHHPGNLIQLDILEHSAVIETDQLPPYPEHARPPPT